jgi:hypothetical protein
MGGEALMSYKGPTNSDFTFTLKLLPSWHYMLKLFNAC